MIQNGTTLPFDRLLIATGADPRPIKAEGLTKVVIAGISLVVPWRRLRIVLLGIASVVLLGSAVYVVTLPVV